MGQPDAFRGSPWNGEPTDDWNRPAYWHGYYRELLAEADPWRRGRVVHREVELLIRMLSQAGELPRPCMLLRYHAGETKVWSVVRVPETADEDGRHLHRELIAVQDERTEHVNRIKGLLAGQGIALPSVTAKFPEELPRLRCWDGSELGADLRQRLQREFARWQLTDAQVKELANERKQRIRRDDTPHVEQVRRLLEVGGVGMSGSWLLVYELFAWRKLANRRQVGAIVGLTPTPYQSGDASREQGISKAGSKVLRRMMVELAWGWLRWQPQSELSYWYEQRFAHQGKRARKVGVVALARKLLIALWRYVEQGEVPAGARLTNWRAKVNAKATGAGQNTAA